MKWRVSLSGFGLLVIGLFLTSACTSSPKPTPTLAPTLTPAPPLFPLVLIDANGEEVPIEKPPERIVSIDSDSVEILFVMGEGHRIVGTHDFVDYPPETADIDRVGNAFALNFERIVELEPDLVYIFFDRFVPDLQDLGLKVLYIKSLNNTLEDVMEHFRLWGRITGNREAAEEEESKFQARLATLEKKLADVDQGPRVYHHTVDFWTPGGDTLVGRIYALLKADFVTQEISGYAQVSPEEIVVRDPEVIVTSESALAQITDNQALEQISAVKNLRVVVPQRGSLGVAGPRLIDAIEELAEFLYPDLFP